MTITTFGWLVIIGGIFLAVSFLCSRWLDRIERRRTRPIAEHCDDYWTTGMESRKRNGASGGSFRA